MVTTTIIGIVFIVVMIYLRRTGNFLLLGKHLYKREHLNQLVNPLRKKGIELKELNHPQKSTMLRPLSSTSTNKSLKSVAQRELPQLQSTSMDLPDSPLFQYYQTQDKGKYKQPTYGLNIRVLTTPDSGKGFLKDTGLDLSKCDKYQCKKQGEVNSHYLIPPLLYKD